MKVIIQLYLVSFLIILPNVLLAGQEHLAPPDFELADKTERAIFIDFISSDYDITFNIQTQTAHVTSRIIFENQRPGMPLFDLVDEPSKVFIDGKLSDQQLTNTPHPDDSTDFTQMRVVKTIVTPGKHSLVIEHELKTFAPNFNQNSVEANFFLDDFEQRGLLERYLPANLEYDQVSMTFKVHLIGGTKKEMIFTNGELTQNSDYEWSVQFPPHFNCSSVFFDIRLKETTSILTYSHMSPNGKNIPVTIYQNSSKTNELTNFQNEIEKTLKKYEHLWGPFPYPTITIFNTNKIGFGMEYAGAAVTDLNALAHELAHSYFGRGVMPANGNAGWIDEAMATFASEPDSVNNGVITPLNMADHSPYFRANDSNGYYFGVNFLVYLGEMFQEKNPSLSLKDFLVNWVRLYNKQIVTTPMLQSALEQYSGLDLNDLFQTYVYGK